MERMLLRLGAVVCLVLAGCAGGDPPNTDTAQQQQGAAFPVTIEAANGTVVIDERPTRIVSLSPTATEMLFAIGAGDQVEAVDDQSNFPADAPTTKLSGFEPNAEAVIGYDPDLVVASDDHADLSQALGAVDVPFLVQPAATELEDTYEQMEQLGRATGNEQEAADFVASLRGEIESAIEALPRFEEPPTYYHELDDTYFSVTSKTFVGQVYGLMGLKNIADGAKGSGSGYPQLSAEYIIDADPDLIFLADTKCCGQSPSTVARRPGWDQISAVRNDAVVPLDDDIASRWGPRILRFIEIVAQNVSLVEEAKV